MLPSDCIISKDFMFKHEDKKKNCMYFDGGP